MTVKLRVTKLHLPSSRTHAPYTDKKSAPVIHVFLSTSFRFLPNFFLSQHQWRKVGPLRAFSPLRGLLIRNVKKVVPFLLKKSPFWRSGPQFGEMYDPPPIIIHSPYLWIPPYPGEPPSPSNTGIFSRKKITTFEMPSFGWYRKHTHICQKLFENGQIGAP